MIMWVQTYSEKFYIIHIISFVQWIIIFTLLALSKPAEATNNFLCKYLWQFLDAKRNFVRKVPQSVGENHISVKIWVLEMWVQKEKQLMFLIVTSEEINCDWYVPATVHNILPRPGRMPSTLCSGSGHLIAWSVVHPTEFVLLQLSAPCICGLSFPCHLLLN